MLFLFILVLRNWIASLVDESFGAHHLEGVVERIESRVRCPMGTEVVVGPGEVLAIVDGKVYVVEGMVRGAVDESFNPVAGEHVAVVDQDGPYLDGHEKGQVQVSLDRADEGKYAVEQYQSMSRGAGKRRARSLVW